MSTDPLYELLRGIERDGKPSLAWLVRWSTAGKEPVAQAWRRSRDWCSMRALLDLAGRGDFGVMATSAVDENARATYGRPGKAVEFVRALRKLRPPRLEILLGKTLSRSSR